MSGDGEPIDVARVEAALTVHTSGLRLLAAADKPIDPSRATILLNHVLGLCDVCVFDLGDGLGPAARTIVQRSNQVVVATDSDRAALTHASKLMHTLSEIGVSSNSVKIVWINRLGTPVDAAQAAIRSTLGRDPIATIGPAAEVMYAALEQARPLILAHPDDPVAIQLTALATALLPHN
jgi:Flp pilus assembly CpaE family ATPase